MRVVHVLFLLLNINKVYLLLLFYHCAICDVITNPEADSLHSSRFLSFSRKRGDLTSERKADERKLGKSEEGVSKEGVGRKGIACSQSQTFYRTPFAHERGAIVQFDWL